MAEKISPLVTSDGEEAYGDFDISMEDLSFLISPRNMVQYPISPSGASFSTTSTFSATNRKVSPLVTDCEVDETRLAQSSLRGYDEQNRPIYASSQTPLGFNAMTKRKTGKKSIFSFEGFEAMDNSDTPNSGFTQTTSFDVEESAAHLAKIHVKGDSAQSSPDNDVQAPRRFVRIPRRPPNATDPFSTDQTQATKPRSMFGFESMDDSTFKKSIASNISATAEEKVEAGQFEDLSPHPNGQYAQQIKIENNPRKKSTYANIEAPVNLTSYDPNTYYPQPQVEYHTYQTQQYYETGGSAIPPLPTLNALQANSSLSSYSPPMAFEVPPQPSLDFYASPPLPQAPPALVSYQQYMQERVQALKYPSYPNYNNNYPVTTQPVYEQYYDYTSDLSALDQIGNEYDDYQRDSKPSAQGSSSQNLSNSRAGKSLAEICKRFVTLYGTANSMQYIAGQLDPNDYTEGTTTLHRVDNAAETLQVHVRRIYELIKILEILSFVTFAGDKRGKFSWRGTEDFLHILGVIQDEGLVKYPLLATRCDLINSSPSNRKGPRSPNLANRHSAALPASPVGRDWVGRESEGRGKESEEHFMVEIICRHFLQLFLVGMNSMSMSQVIQKLIPMEENQTLNEYNKVNATKIRRVYDVTNVLCSLNLVKKKSIPKTKALEAETLNNADAPFSLDSPLDKAKSPLKAVKGTEKADTKVLEWTSFPPKLVREKYLASLR